MTELRRIVLIVGLVGVAGCETGGSVDPVDLVDLVDASRLDSRLDDAASDAAASDGAARDGAAPDPEPRDALQPEPDVSVLDASEPDAGAPDMARDAEIPDLGPDAAPIPTVRVATWNIHCLIEDWPARHPRIVAALARFNPDVILLQEVCEEGETDALADVVAGLEAETGRTYDSARARTHLAWDRYQEGIAVVSALGLASSRVLDLPPGLFPRKAVVAEIDTPAGRMMVAATHLSFGDQADVRRDQMGALTAALQAPAVLGGDLNQSPDEGPIAASGYVDVWANLHPNDRGYTYPADGPRSRIDYVLSAGWTPVSARRIGVAPVPSDHLGVVVDLARE